MAKSHSESTETGIGFVSGRMVSGASISRLLALLALSLTAMQGPTTSSALAQEFAPDGIGAELGFGKFGGGFGAQQSEPAEWSAKYVLHKGRDEGIVEVECTLGDSWHVYSTTQEPGGPLKTEFSLESPKDASLSAAFKPDREPKKSTSEIYPGITLEEFENSVVWTAPIIVPPGFDGDLKLAVDGLTCTSKGTCVPFNEVLVVKFGGRVDAPSQLTAPQASTQDRFAKLTPAESTPFREDEYVVQWTAQASGPIAPGEQGYLKFTAKPDPTFHVYAAVIDDANSATNFGVTQKSGLLVAAPVTPSKVISKLIIPQLPPQRYHKGDVTWALPIDVPKDTKPGEYEIEGFIGYQACTDDACQPPTALKFRAKIRVGSGDATAVKLIKAKRGEAMDAANGKWPDKKKNGGVPVLPARNKPAPNRSAPNDQAALPAVDLDNAGSNPEVDSVATNTHAAADSVDHAFAVVSDSPAAIAEMAQLYDADKKISYLTYSDMDANPIGSGGTSSSGQMTFWSAMFGAFVGGILLNLMPCVFPVLGLKVMGFVKQAGSDPVKIKKHGIAFTAGLLVAMWVLAGVILLLKLSLGQDVNWGAQMGNPYFVCAMIVLLFVLGLNMAGVFEFGTSMTRVGGTVQGKEGYFASFLSGVLTTLIATPCSGPFLGAAMSYTLAQTAGIAMILFTVFGLGIALPYLLLSFFPALINRLPRPGAWMETFKVTMAFALFATVAFFMQSFGNQTGASGLAWLAMALVVIGLAAYYYGTWSAPHVAGAKRILCGYVLPLAIAGVGGWMCYSAAGERSAGGSTHAAGGLAWQKWNPGKVEHTLAKNRRTVWVDYTAHW